MNSDARSNSGGMASTSLAPTRWTDGSMERLVAKRYAAERRFKFFGFAAVGLSVGFLAFLLITMTMKGAGGFTRTEIKLALDFPRSDLMLDPAALKGPEAAEAIGSAGLDAVVDQAAVAQFGEGGGDLFGGATMRILGEKLIADPDLLGKRVELWLPASSKADVAGKGDGDPAIEQIACQVRSPAALQPDLPDLVRRHRRVRSRGLGGAQGHLPDDPGDDDAGLPDRRAVGALPGGIRAAQSLDRPDRGQHQQSGRGAVDHLRPARASRCSSTSWTCRAPLRWSAA